MHMGVQPAGSNLHVGECSAGVPCSVWSTALQENASHFGSGEEDSKNDQRSRGHSPGEKPETFMFSMPKEKQPAWEQVGDRQSFKHR